MARRTDKGEESSKVSDGVGGLLRGLGTLVDLMNKLTEEGQELHRSGELGNDKKGFKAVYGVSVRLGAGGKPEVQPFGNVQAAKPGAAVDDVREPMTDVFDETDHVVVVAEMPGVEAADVHFEVDGDVLALRAARGDRRYDKELVLPAEVDASAASVSFRNGILELRLPKKLGAQKGGK
jgi:HSP20 family protein